MDRYAVILALVLLSAGLFLAERRAALRRQTRPILGRLLVNAASAALAFAAAAFLGTAGGAGGHAVDGRRTFRAHPHRSSTSIGSVRRLVPADGPPVLLVARGQSPHSFPLAISQRPPHRPGPGRVDRLSLPLWRDWNVSGISRAPDRRHRSLCPDVCRVRVRVSGQHPFSSQQRTLADRRRTMAGTGARDASHARYPSLAGP